MRGPARRALARRAFADGRVRTIAFGLFFLLIAYVNVIGYRRSYTTVADRLALARSFGDNKAVRLFYGAPYDLLTVGGYSAWRVGGFVVIVAAAWGLLAAVRALRAEEEAGRVELVLAGLVSRRDAYLAALAALAGGLVLLWLALFAGLALGRLAPGGSAYLALASVTPAAVFMGVGALASQLAPTRRLATELSAAVLGVALVLRVVADTSPSLSWLRWATPLGWAEELRPFAGPRPLLLLAPLGTTVALLVLAGALAMRRDVGAGLLAASDSGPPRLRLLGSPTALALRGERASLVAWLAGTGLFAFVVGVLSTSFTHENISADLRRQLAKVGGASLLTPAGALGFYFLFFVLAASLFACAQLTATRHEEAEGRLETTFALPIGRARWLAGRLLLAAAGIVAVALVAAVVAWAGAAAQHAGVSLPLMLEAGLNCLPAALLFLGLGALAFALMPRATAAIVYGLVATAFAWELFGALLDVPRWTRDLSPFHHVALVPAQPFAVGAGVTMAAIAAAAAVVAVAAFARRDLTGA